MIDGRVDGNGEEMVERYGGKTTEMVETCALDGRGARERWGSIRNAITQNNYRCRPKLATLTPYSLDK